MERNNKSVKKCNQRQETEINQLPDEVLEHILSSVSPYKDLNYCKAVCRTWQSAVSRVIRRKQLGLLSAVKNNNLRWEKGRWDFCRHSHATCCLDGTLYAYGGFSKTSTSFNDLLALDLTTRQWRRVTSAGMFPSPKAAASLCSYKNQLILYGGCAKPSAANPFNPLCIYDELHTYDVEAKNWRKLVCADGSCSRPPTAHHSVTVHGHHMITFGGLLSQQGDNFNATNSVYCLNLETMTWSIAPIFGRLKPPPMFAHSQIYLDETHLLVIGGRISSGEPHLGTWLLTMDDHWHWDEILAENAQWMPPRLPYHPVVRVNDVLVAFSKYHEPIVGIPEPNNQELIPPQLQEENLNGRRGHFQRRNRDDRHRYFNPEVHRGPVDDRRRIRLAVLEQYEKKYFKAKPAETTGTLPSMNLYVADLRNVILERTITWQQPRYCAGSPSDRMLYSLQVGHAELVITGGFVLNGGDVDWPETHNVAFASFPRVIL